MLEPQRAPDRLTRDLFIGRQREMETLQEALEEALTGRGGLVMLVGEPGIGKTRTAQQFASHAAQRGVQVLWGRCSEDLGAPPFWPWVQALRTYAQTHDAETLRAEIGTGAADIAELVPDVREHLADLPPSPRIEDPAQARFRLFDSIQCFLHHATHQKPVVLCLDDLHWADAPSLRLLAFLAPELESGQMLVVGSYRDVELSHQHPLSYTLYDELTTARRMRLHRCIGEARERLYAANLESHLAKLAYHFGEMSQNGCADKAIAYAMQAGARSMDLLDYAEAVRVYRMALDAIELLEPTDAAPCCRLLLACGEAQRKAGEFPQALETLQRAATLAGRLEWSEAFARAAATFEVVTWLSGLPTAPAVRLLEEVLRQIGEEDSAPRARVLGGLARALLSTRACDHAAMYSQQALDMGRRVGDPTALAFNLRTMLDIFWQPEKTAQHLAYATEMVRLSEEAGNSELIYEAHFRSVSCRLELGDIDVVDSEIPTLMRQAEALRPPFYCYIGTRMCAMRALLEGHFAESEQLALQVLTLGRRLHVKNVESAVGLQLFTLRRLQGRLSELELVFREFVWQHSAAAIWRPGLALIYRELGRAPEARAEFEHLAENDFTDLRRDAFWSTNLTYLARVCAFLGDAERATMLYRLLRHYAGYAVIAGEAIVCGGAADASLELLAATMGEWEVSVRHFEQALELNTRIGTKPWLAHTQYEYAIKLLAHGDVGEREKAVALFNDALAIACMLGMHTLKEHITAQMAVAETPPKSVQTYPDDLSPREVEVLRLIAPDKSNRDIADQLCISLSTVAPHVRNILRKTASADRTEAAAYALRQGLLEE